MIATIPREPITATTTRLEGERRLQNYALAALGATVSDHVSSQPQSAELRFLLAHLAAATIAGEQWEETIGDYLNAPDPRDEPLLALASQIGLTVLEILAVELAATVERDAMAGRAVAYLQAPLGGSRPTLGLLSAALGRVAPACGASEAILTGAAVRTGLLLLTAESAPTPERAVAVPVHISLALEDHEAAPSGATVGVDPAAGVPLPPSTAKEIRRQATALAAASGRVLVIRSGSLPEARSIAAAIADLLGGRAAFLDPERTTGVAPWLLLRGLVPVFGYELGPGERRQLPDLPGYDGPRVVLLGADGSVHTTGGSTLAWRIGVPPPAERIRLWQIALADRDLAVELATRHRHGSGRIAHLGRLARHQQAIASRDKPTLDDVTRASWSLEGGGLETLAEPLPDRVPDEALVVTQPVWQELRHLLLRCRWRGELVEGLGASSRARYRPGVRALFVGPSGTGKTLAAGWLATTLGLPLYRVDLASVTSKYIGETEKNLAQLLARAEQSEVVLLFDEADSMFGKRTDVKDANDRFANAQTNYLLQRIESFDGIALLTSNSQARFDAAFTRRLDLILEFPLPGPEERRALWCSHLGDGHALNAEAINMLAACADLAGGHIRNAVLTAAVQAREAGRPICFADIFLGVDTELRKLGRQVPAELRSPVASGVESTRGSW